MYKVGDKLLCVNNSTESYKNEKIVIGRTYTILKICKRVENNGYSFYSYKIDDDEGWFDDDSDYYQYFVLDVKYMRKEKLKKICTK
jgi:hypothetical protein